MRRFSEIAIINFVFALMKVHTRFGLLQVTITTNLPYIFAFLSKFHAVDHNFMILPSALQFTCKARCLRLVMVKSWS